MPWRPENNAATYMRALAAVVPRGLCV